MQVNERYVGGVSRFQVPFGGLIENDPKINQGGNLGLWAESVWLPSIFLTDSRVHWSPVDDQAALLTVPFEDTQETFVARFDPKTNLLAYLEVMRYHGAESQEKTLWINETRSWDTSSGKPALKEGAVIWMDDGKPWAVFHTEEVVYNADVSEYILAEGE
jgi:hypothetical protein